VALRVDATYRVSLTLANLLCNIQQCRRNLVDRLGLPGL